MKPIKFNQVRQIHWRDLEPGLIYKIVNYVVFEDIDRMRLVLSAPAMDSREPLVTYSLWAPDRARYVIEGANITHLRSNGKKDGRWDFEVAQCEAESPMHA